MAVKAEAAGAAPSAKAAKGRPFSVFERMVAWRYLRARRKEAYISVIAGFSFIGMAQLATGQKNSDLLVLHDVEYGTRIDGEWLFWHNRFNPARNHTNSMADVFVVAGPEFGSSGE